MYLRARSLFEKFLVEEKRTRIAPDGRQIVEFVPSGEEILGVISTIETFEREKFKGVRNECDHAIVQKLGHIKAKIGDRLIAANKVYLIKEIDNPGGLSQWYVYWVAERRDLK